MATDDESQVPSDEELLGRSKQLLARFAQLTKVMERGGFVIPDDTYDMLNVRRPRLHQSYTPDEAVAAFGEEPAEWLCDGQFAVLPQQVLCFFALDAHADGHDGRADGIRVESPTSVFWRPGRPDYAPGDEEPWLPKVVREVFGPYPQREQIREHQMFLRRPDGERYLYVGRAALGSWSNPHNPWADFTLRAKLPRDVWVRFGGYPGWVVGVGTRSERVAAGDAAAYARLVAELGPGEGRIGLTRYEQDILLVAVNADRGHVGYTGPDRQGYRAARDPTPVGDPQATIKLPGCCPLPFEVPLGETLPRAAAIEAAAEFFRTGRPPNCIGWSEEVGAAEPSASPDPPSPAPHGPPAGPDSDEIPF
jgi:hypothetical protein